MIMGLIWKVKIKEYKRDYYINPRAYYISCGCHNLNLVLGDMANSCTSVVFFFLEFCNAFIVCLLLWPNGEKSYKKCI